jgi:hypothetical protein
MTPEELKAIEERDSHIEEHLHSKFEGSPLMMARGRALISRAEYDRRALLVYIRELRELMLQATDQINSFSEEVPRLIERVAQLDATLQKVSVEYRRGFWIQATLGDIDAALGLDGNGIMYIIPND